MGVDELGVDEKGVDEMENRRSAMTPKLHPPCERLFKISLRAKFALTTDAITNNTRVVIYVRRFVF